MATRLAIPSELYGAIKQQTAVGKRLSDRDKRLAYKAWLDVQAERAAEAKRLGLYERALEEDIRRARKEEKAAERAAAISGVTQLGTMGALGAYALKGTSLGAKLVPFKA